MLKALWNIAGKVDDLEEELRFFEACGATEVRRDTLKRPDGEDETFGMLRLGGERVYLFEETVFESSLPEPLQPGLTHVVFEVDDLDTILESYAGKGISPLWGPAEVAATFGRRRIAFFRSPSGFVFELVQPLTEGTADTG